ncbi:DUF6404 family protein [Candidatus Pantoea persica]|uniref:DUF6404 family protein n=1 Tax=Candidatus Pantoea persica TaxID=2518128 RepID=UPI002867C256|nr:DUF6404 family protein [Candidatus Pantoea persica]MBA2814885.1 hypothetical protein [Candidatus Pantoea persica]
MLGVVKFIRGWLLFSLLWGLFMWFCFWRQEGMETGMVIVKSLYAGVIYQALTTLIARYKVCCLGLVAGVNAAAAGEVLARVAAGEAG